MNIHQHKDPKWLTELLEKVIANFNESPDVRLLEDEKADDGKSHGSVGECAIAHRFAVHLEEELRKRGYPKKEVPVSIDCEYNRHRGAIKQQAVKDKLRARVEELKDRILKEHPKREGWYVFSVFPDIIVHERGIDANNLLVLELKRASNDFDDELDKIKLRLFTKQGYKYGYDYILGASVIAFDDDKFGRRCLAVGRLFIDGECCYQAGFLRRNNSSRSK